MEYVITENSDGSKVTVQQVQDVLLEILKDVDLLCRKHNITYWLTGGSALGAVRHQGFIPWDDDADIGMLYEDYLKLLEVTNELSDQYVVQSFMSHKEYTVTVPAMKIRKKGTYAKEHNVLLRNKCKDSDGIFIDVFIVDYVSPHKWKDVMWRVRNSSLMLWITLFENMGMNPYTLKKHFYNNARKYGRLNRDSDLIGYEITWCFDSIIHPVVYHKQSIFPIQYTKFEDTTLPIPHDPSEMLNAEVGSNYMQFPAKKDQKPKHFKDVKL